MTASLLGFAALLALVFLRVPIAFAMAAVGAVGFALLRSWPAAWAMVGNVAFETGLSYSLSVVPLFILMGNLLTISGVSRGLYAAANALLWRVRGGLAMASVVACGGFSAVCGSSLATAATMSKVAMPSMRRYGYADSLATGSIAAGGTLGILIPPSVILIVYGLLTETDIGRLFIAGVVPGIVGVVFYVAAVAVVVRLNPAAAPRTEHREPFSKRERFGVLAVAGLFVLILTGIYGGLLHTHRGGGGRRRRRSVHHGAGRRGDRGPAIRRVRSDRPDHGDDLRDPHRRGDLLELHQLRRVAGGPRRVDRVSRRERLGRDGRHRPHLPRPRLRAREPVDDPAHRPPSSPP